MMTVLVSGVEEVRVIHGFVWHEPARGLVPVPAMEKGELYFISEKGFPMIVPEDDVFYYGVVS